jgi:hypothetical protein
MRLRLCTSSNRLGGGVELEMDVRPQTLTAPYPIVPLTSPAPNS